MNSLYKSRTTAETPEGDGREYASFRDPIGLIWRMMRSAHPAAYSSLFHAGLAILARPLDIAFQRAERRSIAAGRQSDLPLIFVVGAPRSGTSLIYQVLAHCLDVSYFTNVDAMFRRSPITAARVFGSRSRRRSARFRSFFGQTAGLTAPNDGFHVWNRFLGTDRYATPARLSDPVSRQMATFFNAWLSTFGKPLLNKNNRNTDGVELLASHLPNAYWIAVRRDPFFVAQSLILARAEVQGSKNVGWGLRSRSSQSSDPLGYVDDVCDQITEIDKKLAQATSALDPGRIQEIRYEDFCRNPTEHVQRLLQWVPQLKSAAASDIDLSAFPVSNKVRLTAPEAQRIRESLLNAEATAEA
jgi:hypothetical protein